MREYGTLIATLVDTHLVNASTGLSNKPLLLALGCRWPNIALPDMPPMEPVEPAAWHEALVRDTLLQALRVHLARGSLNLAESIALLDGLFRNDRWRHCLADLDDTYCLAALCVALSRDNFNDAQLALASSTPGQLRGIFKSWTGIETDPSRHPTTEDIACTFFGSPWYEICAAPGIHHRYMGEFVYLTRPAFTSDVRNYVAMALPVLESP